MQPSDQANKPDGRPPRSLHIAHRRSPSELTPLMVEQLALQQQIEMLQAQQQQILAQQQQFAQAGLLPPGLPPQMMPPPTSGQNLMPPPTYIPGPGSYQYTGTGQQSQGSHRRGHSNTGGSQSSVNGYNQPGGPERVNSGGHTRRHSLALNEAKKAAAIAQAKRLVGNDETSPTQNLSESSSSSSPQTAGTSSFKFPSSPEKTEAAIYKPPSSRGSHRYSASASSTRSFQFPPQESETVSSHERKPSNTGYGHQRSDSRNFNQNWRQSMPQQQQGGPGEYFNPPQRDFVPGHRSRGSFNSSVSSISGFTNTYGGQPNQQRKSLFVPYLPQASLPGLLAEGRLVAGTLRVNRKNRSDAYVSTDGLLDADIFICGSKDRNRALESDLVAVELLEVDEVWGSKREKEEKKKRRGHQPSASGAYIDDNKSDATTMGHTTGSSELGRKGSLKQRPTQKKSDDVEVEGQSLLLVEEEELNDEIKPLYAGHIVAVIDRVPGQMFSGSLGLLRPSSQATKDKQNKEKGESSDSRPADRPKIVWFKPTDKRVPLIAIPTEQAPKDFVDNHEKYSDKIFVASIKRWPITSLHPFGTLVEELGPANDLNIEIEAILRDNNFITSKFSEPIMKASIPFSENSDISQAELNLNGERCDFTNVNSVAITHLAESISDEAIHIKKVGNGVVELGIHVLDITHFIREGSILDREAKKRSVSVSLKQRNIHHLPEDLIEYLSFAADKQSPSISVIFQIDTNTWEITDSCVELGIVKPVHKITLKQVQSFLDDKTIRSALADDVRFLEQLSQNFRKQRLQLDECNENTPFLGLLELVEEKLLLEFTDTFGMSSSQQLLNELNHKANASVAQKLHAVLGDKAFLRRQPDPIISRLESFAETLRLLDIPYETVSSAGLQKALLSIQDDDSRKGLETLFLKCLTPAKYFLPGKIDSDSYGHYLLNLPLYTHCNAPLRRYADWIVHRQIKHVISGTEFAEDISSLASAIDYCNFKHNSARNAQEQALHLFLSLVLGDLEGSSGGQIIREGVVVQVYESAFDVLIPEFGIEKRVHGDQLPLVKAEYYKKSRLLELYWEPGVDSATFTPEDETSDAIKMVDSAETALMQSMMDLALEDAEKRVAALFKEGPYKPTKAKQAAHTSSEIEKSEALKKLLKKVPIRIDGTNHIQEIKLLQRVPILIRADVGKGIPCITIKTINPFLYHSQQS